MPTADRAAQAGAILAALASWSLWRQAGRILLYRTLGSEVDTGPLFELAWRQGKEVAVPRVAANRMEAVLVTRADRFVRGALGTEEPAEGAADAGAWDLAVVPGLLFDRRGHRLGYGRGYYDAFLAQGRQKASVGLCYDWALADALPIAEHDVGVDWIATPGGIQAAQR